MVSLTTATRAAILLLLAGGLGAHAAGAAPPLAVPDAAGALVLVRTTLLSLNDANRTGNYAVLRDLSAPGFRAANPPAHLAGAFAPHRQAKLDLSATAILDPVWNSAPALDETGALRLVGSYPSAQIDLRFDLRFQPVDGAWRPSAISVTLAPPAAVAGAVTPAAGPSGATPPGATTPGQDFALRR